MNFKKLNLGLVALILGFGLVITQSAFKSPNTDILWVFDGSSISEAKTATLYHRDLGEPSCTPGEEMPCKISTPANVDDETQLDAYLSGFTAPEDVLDIAVGIRD
jgi:hypothetical protein